MKHAESGFCWLCLSRSLAISIPLILIWLFVAHAEEPKPKPEPLDIHKDESALIESLKARLAKAEEQLAATQRACQTELTIRDGALNALREYVNRPAPKVEVKSKP